MEQNNKVAFASGMVLVLAIAILASMVLIPSQQSGDIFLFNGDNGTPTPCEGNLGLVLAQNLTDLCDVTIISPLTNELISYNGSQWVNIDSMAFNDTTTCTNLGSGIIICPSFTEDNINLRTLIEGLGIDISNSTTEITITNTLPESTVCDNQVTGFGLCINDNIELKNLVAGSAISLSSNATHIIITNTSPESTVCTNLGSVGEGIYASGNCNFKKLVAGTGITFNANGTRIMINSTGGGESTVCTNQGSGFQVFKDGNCNFRTVLGSADISVTQQTDTITIDYNGTSAGGETTVCDNVGTGNPIHKTGTNCSAFSLIAGNGMQILNTTDDYTIHNNRIGQMVAQVFQSTTKTNIGTSYVDVYITAFDNENMYQVPFGNATKININYMWDYVGTGNHQLRWVDVDNNSNVLFETSTFNVDCDSLCNTGWFDKPSWAVGGNTFWHLELQAKSTVSTDDPISKGYVIYVK